MVRRLLISSPPPHCEYFIDALTPLVGGKDKEFGPHCSSTFYSFPLSNSDTDTRNHVFDVGMENMLPKGSAKFDDDI